MLLESTMWNKSNVSGIEMNEKREFVAKGNETEQGMFEFFMRTASPQTCMDVMNNLEKENVLETIAFTSTRKRSTIAIR